VTELSNRTAGALCHDWAFNTGLTWSSRLTTSKANAAANLIQDRSEPVSRILVLRPPEVPSYFNAGHHLPVFTVSAYLRRHLAARVDALDAAALNVTWKELEDHLWTGAYDVIACMNDLGETAPLGEFVARARALRPSVRLVTFGRLSAQLPGFFERYDLDGIVSSGDYESGVLTFLRWLEDGDRPRPGVAVRAAGRWVPPDAPGLSVPVDEWVLPDIGEIPYDAYDRLYQREENRFCGLPGKRELVVPVARGCPVGCEFCEVWRREGRRERRLPVDRVVAYIRDSLAHARFDYVAMYAPTFTLRRGWVRDLCDGLEASGDRVAWKCTTTIEHLDEGLLARMAAAGCVRVSVGVETLEPGAQTLLPASKRCQEQRFDALAARCRELGVELNCFVMLGLPGATVAGTFATAERILHAGARLRPVFYAPYQEMRPQMDELQVARFNRQLAPDHLDGADASALYALLHADQTPSLATR
jgi:anaerobic magnesium-protoporphyrin IX monomethyl ester cyclase